MELLTSKTFRCLERKAKIMGFELFDMLLIGMTISVSNLLIGQIPFRLFVAWTPALLIAGVLWFGKRGKPDGFMLHWLRFKIGPSVYCAFKEAKNKWKKKT